MARWRVWWLPTVTKRLTVNLLRRHGKSYFLCLFSCPKVRDKFLTQIVPSNTIETRFHFRKGGTKNDNHQLIPQICSERASRRWILATI